MACVGACLSMVSYLAVANFLTGQTGMAVGYTTMVIVFAVVFFMYAFTIGENYERERKAADLP